MDPTLFAIRWDQLFEALAALVLLSMLLERSLSLVFENARFLNYMNAGSTAGRGVLRESIAFISAVAICAYWQFDVPAILLTAPATSWFGYIITGGVIAGGSKGSIKLFRDILGFKSGAYKDYEAEKKNQAATNANSRT